jgi:hypothetical protein
MHPFSPQLHLVAVKGGTRELFSAFPSPTVGDKKKPLTTTLHARQFPFGSPICLFASPLLPPCEKGLGEFAVPRLFAQTTCCQSR